MVLLLSKGFSNLYRNMVRVGFEPTTYLAERSDVLNGLQDQVTTKLKSSLGDCSGRVRITFAANYIYIDIITDSICRNINMYIFRVFFYLNLLFKFLLL